MNSNNFFSALPGFVSGVHALQAELIGVGFVIAFAGLLFHVMQALLGHNLAGMFGSLVRLALVPIIILGVQTWGDMLVTMVKGITTDMGANGAGGDVFQDYQLAIARKLGTAAAANNVNQIKTPAAPANIADGFSPQAQPLNGVTLTHYAYPGDSTPDSNSAQGIGAFPFSSAPGSLIPDYSAALTASAAQAYNISPGQQFSVVTSSGQTLNLLYADVAPESDQRVDVYDPANVLGGGNDFSQGITSINGGPVVAGQTGMASLMPNPGGSIGDQVLWAITLGMSWVAGGIMFLMNIAQQILYLIEIAISPAFIACLMVPALTFLARKFFLTLVSITLWPLAWAVANLVTMALINFLVNPTGNATIGGINAGAVVTGPLSGIAILLVLATWIIGSTIAAPIFIGVLLGSGGGATAEVFGATLGAAAMRGIGMSAGPVAAGAAAVIGNIGGNQSAPVSAVSAARMNSMSSPVSKRPPAEEPA